MGVSGSGKSTVGAEFARRHDFDFVDADSLHPLENVAKMSAGIALDDEDRWPWLQLVGGQLERERATGRAVVVACSTLRRAYRDVLRDHVPDLFFVFLDGPTSVLRDRIATRSTGFMPPSLLASQLATLEPLQDDEWGMRIDIRHSVDEVVDEIGATLHGVGLL